MEDIVQFYRIYKLVSGKLKKTQLIPIMKAIKLTIFLQLFIIANGFSNDRPYVSLDTVYK